MVNKALPSLEGIPEVHTHVFRLWVGADGMHRSKSLEIMSLAAGVLT